MFGREQQNSPFMLSTILKLLGMESSSSPISKSIGKRYQYKCTCIVQNIIGARYQRHFRTKLRPAFVGEGHDKYMCSLLSNEQSADFAGNRISLKVSQNPCYDYYQWFYHSSYFYHKQDKISYVDNAFFEMLLLTTYTKTNTHV